jgi:putative transcriptional regulator
MRVKNRIRELRFHADEMTQQQLADKISVTRQTINAIEGEKYSPTLEVAFQIAHVFGVPLDQVFSYEAPRGRR